MTESRLAFVFLAATGAGTWQHRAEANHSPTAITTGCADDDLVSQLFNISGRNWRDLRLELCRAFGEREGASAARGMDLPLTIGGERARGYEHV